MIAPLPARTAHFTPNGDAEPGSGLGTLTAWCPHCERLHHHGAAGRGAAARTERRGAHCDNNVGAPLAGRSFDLAVEGQVDDPDAVRPDVPMVRAGKRLHRRLADAALPLRKSLLQIVLGRRLTRRDLSVVEIEGSEVAVLDLGLFWRMQDKNREAEGRGLLDLAAALYGISPGIAARRIIETVAGVSLPPDTALEVEAAVDRWANPAEEP